METSILFTNWPRLSPPSTAISSVCCVCGYGIVIHKMRDPVADVLNGTDWRDYSNLAAHNARHISMYHIRRALTDAGFVDAA